MLIGERKPRGVRRVGGGVLEFYDGNRSMQLGSSRHSRGRRWHSDIDVEDREIDERDGEGKRGRKRQRDRERERERGQERKRGGKRERGERQERRRETERERNTRERETEER